MKLNDFINVCSCNETIQIMNYDQKKDDFGEEVFFLGSVFEFAPDESLVKKLGNKTVKAISRGLVSIIVAV